MRSKEDYIEGILKNDEKLVEEIYAKNFLPIVRFVQNNSGSSEDARDIFQDALIIIFKKSQEGKLVLTSSFSTFLYAICRNLWLKKLRKKSSSEVTIPDGEEYMSDDDLDGDITKQEKFALYKQKFTLLDESCQKVLKLFFEGKSMKEIGDKLGFTLQYAKKRKYKCKNKLVELIQKDPIYKELIDD